jgi:CRP/FNR family transcriptional activator FtrB
VRSEDLEQLRHAKLFAGLMAEDVARVTRGAFVQTLPKGAELFQRGDPADFLHVILSGRVALTGTITGSTDVVVDFFSTGDTIIAPAVMLQAPYLMSCRIVTDARILMLPGESFRNQLAGDAKLAHATAMMLARYWRRLVRQIMELKLRSAPERLAAYLLTLTRKTEGSATVALAEERKLIAGRLGIAPESLSRAFAMLKDEGITGRGAEVHIADVARLRAYARVDEFVDERDDGLS